MYRIGEFTFDAQRAELCKEGTVKRIEPQTNELLKLFVENQGELVSREMIVDRLWPQRVISDDAFRAVIKKLRKSLEDNAKAPSYIRTVPMKGFVFIAEVKEVQPDSKKAAVTALVSMVVVIVCIALLLLFWPKFLVESDERRLEQLTTMDGSEVSPSYNANTEMLIFSHRANKDDYLQIYSKSLKQDTITRLTFDEANYANAYFSPSGDRVAYTRSTPKESSIVVANFSKSAGLTQLDSLPDSIARLRYVQAWSANGEGLYLSDIKRTGVAQAIWYYHIDSHKLTSITAPSGPGQGDYYAKESHDGKRLAILRDVGAKNTELLVQHLDSGELTHIYKLPHAYHHLVWEENNNLIKLSNFYGDFASYDLVKQEFRLIPATVHINNVFHSCGIRCVFARQHNGNYLDLIQHPNPFGAKSVKSLEYFEFEGAEDLPVFGDSSGHIYFVIQRQGEAQVVVLRDKKIEVLQRFDKNSQFEALQVSSDESWLAGIVDGRLFLVSTQGEGFHYLSTALERVSTPQWGASGQYLNYARIEQGLPVLYRYELKSGTTVRVQEGLYAHFELPNGNVFFVDDTLNGWYRSGDEPRLIARLPSPSSNRWSLQGDNLYFTEYDENLAYLHRINLITGEGSKRLLAKNRYRLNFDLSKNGNTMLGIRSVLAQSNLVKMEY